MDYQRLPTVPDAEQLFATGLGRARKRRNAISPSYAKRRSRATVKETEGYLTKTLLTIRRKYPDLSTIEEPLISLIELDMSLDDARQALGSLQWAASRIGKLALRASALIGADPDEDAKRHESSFLGRTRSILERIDPSLTAVRKLRSILVELPVLRDDALLIAIAGFPNVGKSTLLSRLTSAKPEIAPYAFTTKGLNLGLLEVDGVRMQLIDTPGTLDREHENTIEKRARIIIAHADLIVYVFDPTEQYPLEDQITLYNHLTEPIRYVSKTDLVPVPEAITNLGQCESEPLALVAVLSAQARSRASLPHRAPRSPTASE